MSSATRGRLAFSDTILERLAQDIKDVTAELGLLIQEEHIGGSSESLVGKILPHLARAQVYDALSYLYDHRGD